MPMYPKLSDMVPRPEPSKWNTIHWYDNDMTVGAHRALSFGFKHTEASAYFDHRAYWDAIIGGLRK